MVNAVVRASKIGRKARKKLSGFCCVISREVDGTVHVSREIRITFGETGTEELEANEVVVSRRNRDFMIDACDYVIPGIDSKPIAPQDCDLLTVVLASGSTVFQVINREDARPFRRSTRYGDVLRVFAKEKSNEQKI